MRGLLGLLHGCAFSHGFWLATDQFAAVLLLGFIHVLEILLGIVIKFLLYLLSYSACFFYDGIVHFKAPLTLQACR